MNNDNYINFLDLSENAIKQNEGSAVFSLDDNELKNPPFNINDASKLSTSLCRTIENLDEELNKFEKNFVNKHNAVFWASDYEDVFENLRIIFKSQRVRSARLPSVNASTIFREIGLKYFLKQEKIELTDSGDVQFFNIDMLLPDNGALLLLNQTNNSFQKLSNNTTNIFFTTIDRILPNINLVDIYRKIVTYANGAEHQDMVIFKGSPNCNNYLFIVDNRRTVFLQEKPLRQALTCVNCGRCSDVCPVLQTIGETPYNNVFTGPVANIILPYFESFETYVHVVYACTMCGRCEEVCPISLPVRDMIIASRQSLMSNDIMEKKDRRMMAALRKFLTNRSKMNASVFNKKHLLMKYTSPDVKKSRRPVQFCEESCAKMYQKNHVSEE